MTHILPRCTTWSNYDVIVCRRKSIPKVILTVFQKRPILSKMAKIQSESPKRYTTYSRTKRVDSFETFCHFPCSNERGLYLLSTLSWAVLYTKDISILKSFEAPLKTNWRWFQYKQSNKQSGTFFSFQTLSIGVRQTLHYHGYRPWNSAIWLLHSNKL